MHCISWCSNSRIKKLLFEDILSVNMRLTYQKGFHAEAMHDELYLK